MMNLFLENWIIKMIGKVSKSDIERMITHNTVIITVGDESCWEEIFLLSVNAINKDLKFWVEIYSESQVFPPSIIPNHIDGQLLISYDNYISLIDLYEGIVLFVNALDSIVYFVKCYNDTIIVISELSIVQMSLAGFILTSHLLDDVLE